MWECQRFKSNNFTEMASASMNLMPSAVMPIPSKLALNARTAEEKYLEKTKQYLDIALSQYTKEELTKYDAAAKEIAEELNAENTKLGGKRRRNKTNRRHRQHAGGILGYFCGDGFLKKTVAVVSGLLTAGGIASVGELLMRVPDMLDGAGWTGMGALGRFLLYKVPDVFMKILSWLAIIGEVFNADIGSHYRIQGIGQHMTDYQSGDLTKAMIGIAMLIGGALVAILCWTHEEPPNPHLITANVINTQLARY